MYNLKLYPLLKIAFTIKQFLNAFLFNVYFDFISIIKFYLGIKKLGKYL